jgi:hypothetical protein
MAGAIRKPQVKEVPLSEIKDNLLRFLREAETADSPLLAGFFSILLM